MFTRMLKGKQNINKSLNLDIYNMIIRMVGIIPFKLFILKFHTDRFIFSRQNQDYRIQPQPQNTLLKGTYQELLIS